MTTADDIFAAAPRGVVKYKIGEAECTLREMSVTEQMEWNQFYADNQDDFEKLYCRLIVLCCVEMKDQDPAKLAEKMSPKVIMDMGNKIIELSGLKEDAAKKD